MMRIASLLAGLVLLFGVSPALAHHIAGKIACDVDLDGTFAAGDTPLSGIEVDITSFAQEKAPLPCRWRSLSVPSRPSHAAAPR